MRFDKLEICMVQCESFYQSDDAGKLLQIGRRWRKGAELLRNLKEIGWMDEWQLRNYVCQLQPCSSEMFQSLNYSNGG